MRYYCSCLLWLSLLCWSVQGQSGAGDLLEPLNNYKPATCTASFHIMVGSDLKWKMEDTGVISEATENCTFTNLKSQSVYNTSSFVNARAGDYHYECLDNEGNMTIVETQYNIAICRGCTKQHTVMEGDFIQWSFVGASQCKTRIMRNGQPHPNAEEDMRSLQLKAPGLYTINCVNNTELSATIMVEANPNENLKELLYTHAALMAVAFGLLLPIGAFLAHNKVTLAHKVLQPLGIILGLCGLVMVIVYVELSHGDHFRRVIHSTVGLVLLILASIGMPLLLLKKPRIWHKKMGQIVVFFGMANILLGLSIFPVQPVVAIVLCAVYGVWLVIAIVFYVFYPRSSKRVSSYSLNVKLGSESEEQAYKSRNSSFSSIKGPQRLDKNIISDDKMIQLRKKSMDFLDSTKAREQLTLEFQNHPLYHKPILENGDYYSEERRGSKPDQESDYDLETSRAPLCMQDSFSATPDELDSDEKVRMYLRQTRDQSADYTEESCDELDSRPRATVTRAHTFQHKPGRILGEEDDRGGSLRITRHSKRARPAVEEVFPPILSEEQPESEQKSSTLPTHVASAAPERRRKGAFIPPPIITTTPVEMTDSSPVPGCPFHGGLAAQSRQRGVSPTPSGDSVFDSSPRPQRKKKVSVAQIEATVVPNTPINLVPPPGSQLRHSISHDTMRTHHDVFTDNAFRSVMQISQDAIVCANSVGDIVFWSAGAATMFGYTPGEAIGSNLEMIVPLSYREKHRGGINKRTGETLKYLRKHSYAPEEQKHARLYEVRALTKSGHEIPAEVHVTSFVIEEELFYTGVITEMSRKTGGSIGGSTSDINEQSLKQRALAVGAQMKLAHNLLSANHISKTELERVLVSSLHAADFEVESHQTEQMVAGIMKEGDPDSTGVISFVNLIKLLSKHQLYISESGNIARYGKTKGSEAGNSTRGQRVKKCIKELFAKSATSLIWILLYVLLNIFVLVVGVLVNRREGLARFAFGSGPVLSMNCVFVLFPTLNSVVTALRSIVWMNKLLPLKGTTIIHIIVSVFILFWSLVHMATHFANFAIQTDNATETNEPLQIFRDNIRANLMPTITGVIILVIFAAMGLSAIGPFRKAARFIPFHILHWILLILFYALLIVHGVAYFNHSFWKWLLPLVVIVISERIYRYAANKRHSVKVKSAGRYDDQSRTAIIELEKPSRFKFEPGQFIKLNLPWIGQFNWQECQISSGPKDKILTIHIPHSTDPWFNQAFNYLKRHPYNMPSAGANQKRNGKQKNKEAADDTTIDDSHPAAQKTVTFTGPFGPSGHCTQLFDYKVSTIVCAGGTGPHTAKAVIKRFLEYRKGSSCHCGCTPILTRLYFIWVVPSGNDFEWFSDYLSELCEDEHVHRYLDVRVFLTNINSPPDELASALLQLGIKAAGPTCIVRRPSQPQLNNLHSKTSYGLPDFPALLDYISAQNATLWGEKETDFGVFTVGSIQYSVEQEIVNACKTSSKPGQLSYTFQHIYS